MMKRRLRLSKAAGARSTFEHVCKMMTDMEMARRCAALMGLHPCRHDNADKAVLYVNDKHTCIRYDPLRDEEQRRALCERLFGT